MPPIFIESPGDLSVVAGSLFVLNCSSTNKIEWFVNNRSIQGVDGHQLMCDGTSLLVTAPLISITLNYQCVAVSSYGRSITDALVIVTSMSIVCFILS